MKTKKEWKITLLNKYFRYPAHSHQERAALLIEEVSTMLELRDNRIKENRELLYDFLRFQGEDRRREAFNKKQ